MSKGTITAEHVERINAALKAYSPQTPPVQLRGRGRLRGKDMGRLSNLLAPVDEFRRTWATVRAGEVPGAKPSTIAAELAKGGKGLERLRAQAEAEGLELTEELIAMELDGFAERGAALRAAVDAAGIRLENDSSR